MNLTIPALKLLVAANAISAAPLVRAALGEIPPKKRRAFLQKLLVGVTHYQAFQLKNSLQPVVGLPELASVTDQRRVWMMRAAIRRYLQSHYYRESDLLDGSFRIDFVEDLAADFTNSKQYHLAVGACLYTGALFRHQVELPMPYGKPIQTWEYEVGKMMFRLKG